MTLKDIADKANVSMMTVSNVINGKHNRVSAQTIERVNQIIEECGYVPNLSARSLTNKTSNIIGVVIPTDTEEDYNLFENPYASIMFGTIESELRHNGYYTIVRSISRTSDFITLLKNWNVDGIIFLFPELSNSYKEFLDSATCPVALFDNYNCYPNVINVCSADEKGLYLSTKYLINYGHRSIAFVANYKGNPLLTSRLNGYKKALAERNIPYREENVFQYAPTYEGGLAAGKQIASTSNDITAVVTTADICAVGVMEGARLGGLRVPLDLSIIGYDDLPLCQYTTPKLTSVSQNITEKAKVATNLLLEQIRTGKTDQQSPIVLDVNLIERQSAISIHW